MWLSIAPACAMWITIFKKGIAKYASMLAFAQGKK